MTLSEYFQVLNRRKWIIFLTPAMTIAVILLGGMYFPPMHTASAVLHVDLYKSRDSTSYTQILLLDRLMNTYVRMAVSDPLLKELRDGLGLQDDAPAKVKVELIPDTELLRVIVSDHNPIVAQEFANALVERLVENPFQDSRVYVVNPPTIPETSKIRSTAIQVGLAFMIGIIAGMGLAFVMDSLDTRLYTTEQVKETSKLRILGEIPACHQNHEKRLVEDPACNNEFKRLGMNLLTEANKSNLHVLLITSARPKEGKSTIAASLAYSMVQLGQNVTLIDADLYHPSLLKYFSPSSQANLQKLRSEDGLLANGLKNTEFAGIYFLDQRILPGRLREPHQNEFHSLPFEQSRGPSDIVLIDSPAFLEVADAATWIPWVDGVLIVARLGWVKEPELRKLCEQLTNLNANQVGIVVNGSKSRLSGVFRQYYKQGKSVPILEIHRSKGHQAANESKISLVLPEPEIVQGTEEKITNLALPEPEITQTPANLTNPSQRKGNSNRRRAKRNA